MRECLHTGPPHNPAPEPEPVQSRFWFELAGRRVRLIGTFQISPVQAREMQERIPCGPESQSGKEKPQGRKEGSSCGPESCVSIRLGGGGGGEGRREGTIPSSCIMHGRSPQSLSSQSD